MAQLKNIVIPIVIVSVMLGLVSVVLLYFLMRGAPADHPATSGEPVPALDSTPSKPVSQTGTAASPVAVEPEPKKVSEPLQKKSSYEFCES